MGTDLRLANKIWRAATAYAKDSFGHLQFHDVDYLTAILLVAALLEDKELAQELYNQADVKQEI